MSQLRATVRNGRLVMDVPVDLPEGLTLDLVVDDEGDDLDDEERKHLHAAIDRAREQADRGEMSPASEVLQRLRDRHGQ